MQIYYGLSQRRTVSKYALQRSTIVTTSRGQHRPYTQLAASQLKQVVSSRSGEFLSFSYNFLLTSGLPNYVCYVCPFLRINTIRIGLVLTVVNIKFESRAKQVVNWVHFTTERLLPFPMQLMIINILPEEGIVFINHRWLKVSQFRHFNTTNRKTQFLYSHMEFTVT